MATLGGVRMPVSCGVGKYALSAHADAQEIVGLVSALAPREVLLVHGDDGARAALARALDPVARERVELPRNGEAGRLEVNAAFRLIEQAFAALPHRPRRKSKKSDHEGLYLEVAFISHEVGERYADVLRRLAGESGWRIQVARHPDQNAILEAFRRQWPAGARIRKGPGIRVERATVEVTLAEPVAPETIAAVDAQLREETGYGLVALSPPDGAGAGAERR